MFPHPRHFGHTRPASQLETQFQPKIDAALGVPRRVYIIGTGSVGKLIAHSLGALMDPPPITLLFHKPSMIDAWREAGERIQLVTAGVPEAMGGFDVELAMPNRREHGKEIDYMDDPMRTFISDVPNVTPDGTTAPRGGGADSMEPIDNLIVTTKATTTVSAISAVKHRLSTSSTICFLQNGMGVIDEVNRDLFPDESTRPNYMQGIISHGVHSSSPFTATHAGMGTIQLGLLPRGPLAQNSGAPPSDDPGHELGGLEHSIWALSSRYLLRTLTRSPALCAVGLSPTDLLCAQLEKLAVNCLINPITALIDVRNGALLHNFHFTRVMRLLLSEISLVIRSLPELQGMPNLDSRFATSRLETMAMAVADKTRENISSMLADTRRGLHTEVDYINGYIVKRGEEVGVRCVMNYMLACLVNGKQNVVHREIEEDITILGKDDAIGYSIGEGGGKRKSTESKGGL
ncbi:2-dehydropantoate 2-reductase [Diplodia corticola]|uniref:2-dehydropantoate 2-reductase n=1 Tax=Diplodia corticola TaxID=236234 RepID=A0A1J9RB87_9PEZI|nr:2-dehydropantoate 2-reductase [Diplodia corticola]OJD37410.1 2-dehydropantoate 2-reductase [Diplodia corticola]